MVRPEWVLRRDAVAAALSALTLGVARVAEHSSVGAVNVCVPGHWLLDLRYLVGA